MDMDSDGKNKNTCRTRCKEKGRLVGNQRLHWVVFCPSPVFFSLESAVFLEADLAREVVCNSTIQTDRWSASHNKLWF